jgi:hypothetical protein
MTRLVRRAPEFGYGNKRKRKYGESSTICNDEAMANSLIALTGQVYQVANLALGRVVEQGLMRLQKPVMSILEEYTHRTAREESGAGH